MQIRSRVFVRLVPFWLGACKLFGAEEVCTLAGCGNHGLFVQFDRAPAQPVRVEAVVRGEFQPVIVECADPRRCSRGVLFPSFFPDVVRLRVLYGQANSEREFTVSYSTSQPNGPDCPPTCRSGSVSMQLPQA